MKRSQKGQRNESDSLLELLRNKEQTLRGSSNPASNSGTTRLPDAVRIKNATCMGRSKSAQI